MPQTEIKYKLRATVRSEIRRELVELFLKENPGTGNGPLSSKYKYVVEESRKGEKVYLSRPARLNKGFDFEVCVEGLNVYKIGQRKTTRPSHKFILDDLANKKAENPGKYKKLFNVIETLYKNTTLPLSVLANITFKSGISIEMLLYIIKWLFIEQDITYWNWSGRSMLFNYIKEI